MIENDAIIWVDLDWYLDWVYFKRDITMVVRKMTETRRMIYCPQCKHAWLIENKKVEWAGDSRSLSQYEKELGRSRGECQCGLDLYSLEYKKKNGRKNKKKNISRNN